MDMVFIPKGQPYEAGEPYEFLSPLFTDAEPDVRYRCFRGQCKGFATQTADRNTHNGYHNRKGD